MNSVIYKWRVVPGTATDITLPTGSEPLTVQHQRGDPMLWVKQPVSYNTDSVYRFYVMPTGLEFDHPGQYLCTFQTEVGKLVWHVFYEVRGQIGSNIQ